MDEGAEDSQTIPESSTELHKQKAAERKVSCLVSTHH